MCVNHGIWRIIWNVYIEEKTRSQKLMRSDVEAEQSRNFRYSGLVEMTMFESQVSYVWNSGLWGHLLFSRTKVAVNNLPLTCSMQGQTPFIFFSKCFSSSFSSLCLHCCSHTPCYRYLLPEWLQLPPNWSPQWYLFCPQYVFHIAATMINPPITPHCF